MLQTSGPALPTHGFFNYLTGSLLHTGIQMDHHSDPIECLYKVCMLACAQDAINNIEIKEPIGVVCPLNRPSGPLTYWLELLDATGEHA